MIAHRRTDVADLNTLARDRMLRDGHLGDEEVRTDRRAFAVGDRVIARRNDRRAGVVNGTRADVIAVDLETRSVAIRTKAGGDRRLDSTYLDEGWLDHAYALTAHAAQGATVDQSFVLGSDELYREWGYTALSRHHDRARFYVVSPGSVERALPGLEPDHDTVTADVVSMLSTSRRKELALDVLDRAGPTAAERARSIAQAEIERAERRIAAMREERLALGRLQRSQRARVDQDIARQVEAIDRWSAQAETITASAPSPAPVTSTADVEPASFDLDKARVALLDPDERTRRVIGSRPASLHAREAWTREAVALIGRDAPTPDPSPPPPSMDDVGIEL